MMANIRFMLNGCDICFVAEAPEDITLKQLLEQTDKIFPDWCACGICSLGRVGLEDDGVAEIKIGYNSIEKIVDCACQIREDWRDNDG